MPSPITRRRFLRDSAIVSGGAAVLVGVDRRGASAASAPPYAADRIDSLQSRRGRSSGAFTQIEYGGASDDFLIQWTRSGGSSSLQLTPTVVRLDVPIWGAQEIGLADFEQGRGEHEILQYFGPAALEQLRNEVTALRLFATP